MPSPLPRVDGEGPFLWLSATGPRRGFRRLPPGGMCVSAFLFVVQDGKLLLGQYADDARWEDLVGLDEERWRAHGRGWTVPASQLKFGEEPRAAAQRIAREVLGLDGLAIGEPRVESDHYVPARFPELGMHYDLWLLFTAALPEGARVERPPWYRALELHDPRVLAPSAYARGHEDVVARWLGRDAP